jgi:tripartite-type tricarboxylate transporter receptor subunit TctC
MNSVRFVVLAMLTLPAGGAAAATAPSGEDPSRPIRWISASAPGGASDLIARTVGTAMADALGVQIVVDNRPGAGNTVGAEIASKAAPDGYTVFGCNIASLAVAPSFDKKLAYDPDRDFAAIGMIASNPNVFTIHPSLPARNIQQFIALAKAHPGKLNYGSAGLGNSPTLSMELFRMQADIRIVLVAYKGVSAAVLDLIAGRIEAMTSTVPSVLPALRGGKVRPLGVTSLKRDSDVPEVPTIAEQGFPGFEVVSWQGLCTQAAVPPAALARLRTVFNAVAEHPDIRKRLQDQAFQPHYLPADQFAAWARAERTKWAKVIKAIGIEPQ